jgi:hypothetical protein
MTVTLAALQARADGGQFTLTQTSGTNLVSGAAPLQKTHPLQYLAPHGSANRTAIGWSAIYRTRRLTGDVLVVDTAVASAYVQSVLDHAWTMMDSVDLDMNLVNYPPNTHGGPSGQPATVAGTAPTGVPD